jgi:nucleotide-binding universal stress UspA family protein
VNGSDRLKFIANVAVGCNGMANPFGSILVPVDLSSCSRAALELALALSKIHSARIDIVHANSDSPGLRHELEGFVASHIGDGESLPLIHVVPGSPRDVILKLAEQLDCDVIVLGTHGRTGRERSLAGSVAESVVRGASCPVITVREPG